MRKLILLVGLTFIVTISNSQTIIDKEVVLKWNDGNTNWITSDTYSHILTSGLAGSAYPFQTRGNLVLQPRPNAVTDIVFGTGATPTVRMVIKGNGKIGIGTTAPGSELTLKGTFEIRESDDGNEAVKIIGGSTSSVYEGYAHGIQTIRIHSLTGQKTYFNAGNVGIGTISPYKSLDVVGIGSFGDPGGAGSLGIEVGQILTSVPSSQIRAIIGISNSDIGVRGDLIIQPRSSVPTSTRFYIAGSEKMRVHLNGNIGIGTVLPEFPLTVNGTIGAKEIIVTNDIAANGLYLNSQPTADFVFEPDYNLRPIEEVESFVNENKHLPEIASAKDMEENGINQAEMNQKLLQKIEELTLYMIDVNKEVKVLKQENRILKEKVNTL